MGNISKLIGSIAGSLIAILLVYLASKGFGTCDAPAADGSQSCTVLGFTTAQVVGGATTLISALFVFFFPANKPS